MGNPTCLAAVSLTVGAAVNRRFRASMRLRICFAYLKTGGRLIIETKMMEGEASACSYSGVVEKGWNWYAPTREAMGRWLVDAGFEEQDILVHRRPVGRLLASAVKTRASALPENAGFSRPGSWLEGVV